MHNQPLRILQICSARTHGGGETHVIQLVEQLRRMGHHVEVAGRKGGAVRPDHPLKFTNAMDLRSVLQLRRIVQSGKFDTVHAHIARDYPIAAAALVGLSRPQLILTRHLLRRVRANPLYRRVDGWIAPTSQIGETLAHLRPKNLAVIPNWVDSTHYGDQSRPFCDTVVVGILGQIAPHKGHDDAIAMIRQLGPGFQLRIGGVGQENYLELLKDQASPLPVDFPGYVDAAEFLQSLDILILPSWEEPFGIVILEAMAAGINVIATQAGGPPEILEEGRAGLLVPPQDPDALAKAVRRLSADRALARQLRDRARLRAADYGISRIVPRIDNFYRKCRG